MFKAVVVFPQWRCLRKVIGSWQKIGRAKVSERLCSIGQNCYTAKWDTATLQNEISICFVFMDFRIYLYKCYSCKEKSLGRRQIWLNSINFCLRPVWSSWNSFWYPDVTHSFKFHSRNRVPLKLPHIFGSLYWEMNDLIKNIFASKLRF